MDPSGHEPDAARQLRRELLARIVPPLLHMSNNALAALRGGIELLEAGSGRVDSAFVFEQVERLATALDNLGHLARDPSDPARTFELKTVLDRALALVQPLANERRVELQRRNLVRAVVEGPEERLLHQLVLELAGPIASEGVPPGSRMRLSVRRRGDLCLLRLVRTGAPTPEVGRAVTIEQAGVSLAVALGGTYRARLGEHRHGAQWVLSAHSLVDLDDASAVTKGRVLLFAPVGEAAELCEVVLSQEGYTVSRAESLEQATERADLFVFDDASARGAMDVERQLAKLTKIGPPVLVLSSSGVLADSVSTLPKPFGPRELVHAVERVMAARRS